MIARLLSVAALVVMCATAFADTSAPTPVKGMKATVLPDGLEYVDMRKGTGAEAKAGKKVKVHYTGWLADSKKSSTAPSTATSRSSSRSASAWSSRAGTKASRG